MVRRQRYKTPDTRPRFTGSANFESGGPATGRYELGPEEIPRRRDARDVPRNVGADRLSLIQLNARLRAG